MKIEKAIEVLIQGKERRYIRNTPMFIDALELGIAALRAVKQLKEWNFIFSTHELLGEEEDQEGD